ncbi:hypothetical protein Tco_0590949 [Tanacetum coccineum]
MNKAANNQTFEELLKAIKQVTLMVRNLSATGDGSLRVMKEPVTEAPCYDDLGHMYSTESGTPREKKKEFMDVLSLEDIRIFASPQRQLAGMKSLRQNNVSLHGSSETAMGWITREIEMRINGFRLSLQCLLPRRSMDLDHVAQNFKEHLVDKVRELITESNLLATLYSVSAGIVDKLTLAAVAPLEPH